MEKKKCLHCGYTWQPRIETEPKACPKCKSPRWNEPKRKVGRPKQAEKCWYCNNTGKRVNLVDNTWVACFNCDAGKKLNQEVKS